MFSSDIVFAPDPIPAGEWKVDIFNGTKCHSVSLVVTFECRSESRNKRVVN